MKGRIVIIAASIAIVLLLGYSKPSRTRRVIVSWPERWIEKESRSCVLAGEDPVSKLPHLDCDLPASDKPRGQMVVMDVKFATTMERQEYVEWACRRKDSSLICGN